MCLNKMVSVFFNGVSLWISNWQLVSIGLGSGLAMRREQIIMRHYDGIVYCDIYATLSLDVLKNLINQTVACNSSHTPVSSFFCASMLLTYITKEESYNLLRLWTQKRRLISRICGQAMTSFLGSLEKNTTIYWECTLLCKTIQKESIL